MTDNMLDLARKNAVQGGYTNVEFVSHDTTESKAMYYGSLTIAKVKSNITSIAILDSTADIVCSNCVLNLVPEPKKPAVFHEIFRILKPGGRVAISDVLAHQPLPDVIRKNPAMLVGCISGASTPAEYEKWMLDAGFKG